MGGGYEFSIITTYVMPPYRYGNQPLPVPFGFEPSGIRPRTGVLTGRGGVVITVSFLSIRPFSANRSYAYRVFPRPSDISSPRITVSGFRTETVRILGVRQA